MAIPLIRCIKERFGSKIQIILSLWSESALSHPIIKQNVFPFFFLPFDLPPLLKKVFKNLAPSAIFVMKYELWLNFFSLAHKNKIPLFLVSFRVNPSRFQNNLFYRLYLKECLKKATFIFTISEKSAKHLASIKIKNVQVAGDIRLDTLSIIRNEGEKVIQTLPPFPKDKDYFIAGSIWMSDILFLKNFIKENVSKFYFILAPHKIEKKFIDYLLKEFGSSASLYSNFAKHIQKNFSIIILDTYGILKYIYYLGRIAYIGGAKYKGLHNIFEPLAWGTPVIFLKPHSKYEEAYFFQELGIAKIVFSYKDIENALQTLSKEKTKKIINKFLTDPFPISKEIVTKSLEYIQKAKS